MCLLNADWLSLVFCATCYRRFYWFITSFLILFTGSSSFKGDDDCSGSRSDSSGISSNDY